MFERGVLLRIAQASAMLSLAGCGGSDEGKSRYTGAAATFVPGCEDYNHEPCAIEQASCRKRLAELAACVWGGPGTEPAEPEVTFISRADYREEVLQSLVELRELSAEEDRWGEAWVMLGLATRNGLSDEALADFNSEFVLAYYDSEAERITYVMPDEPPDDPAYSSAALVHEYVHALQDRADDLESIWEGRPESSDAAWALTSLIEGEAEFYTTRVLAAMFGLDLESLDFGSAFANLRRNYEASVFEGSEPLLESQGLIDYAYGPEFCHHVWEAEGRAGLRELFQEPPMSFYEAFATVHGAASKDVERVRFVDPVIEGNDAQAVFDWDSLGPWGIHLLLTGADEELALAWRGDQLAIFELQSGETALRWQFELADEAAASRFAAALSDDSTYVDGTRVVLAWAPDDYAWLLEPTETEPLE